MQKFSTIVVGGGAAGIVAAISARRKGESVVICERMPQLGKKILASGNGRCNLSNQRLDSSSYNQSARPIVKSVLDKFGKSDIDNLFKTLGLELRSEGDRVFPATNQSSSVLKVLESGLKRLSIPVELNFEVSTITHSKEGFIVTSKTDKKVCSDSLILACGGKSYPALGSDGSAYKFAKNFGHNIVEPVPAAVPIIVKDRLCHLLQGQRISAKAKSIIDGNALSEAEGEVLFTKYGLSGTAILDVSEELSVAMNRNRNRNVAVSIDMVPFMTAVELKKELADRVGKGFAPEELVMGILPNKFGQALKESLKSEDPETIAAELKERRFNVTGTRGWNEAEFTAGGVDMDGISPVSLESKFKEGLYFAGEILDVNGRRGGYNLAWAWASGFIAGLSD